MNKAELPIHPTLALAERRLIAAVPTAGPRVEGLIREINDQLINNWTAASVMDGQAIVPYTWVELPGPSSTTRKHVEATFPGIGGQVGDRVDHATGVLLEGYAKAKQAEEKGEEPITKKVILLGWPTSVGGKVSKEWNRLLRKEGPSIHGKAAAEILAEPLGEETIEQVVFNGLSKGSRTAAYALTHFPEYTGRRALVRDHQPRNMANATLGFPIDNGIGRLRKKRIEQQLLPDQSEGSFLTTNAELFDGLVVFDSRNQKLLKGQALVRDWLDIKYPRPDVPADVKITDIHGLLDFTHISLGSIVWLLKDVQAKGSITKVKGPETKIFDLSMHSGFPFPDLVVKRMAAALENS